MEHACCTRLACRRRSSASPRSRRRRKPGFGARARAGSCSNLGAVSVELYGFPYVFMHRRDLHGVLVQGIQRLKLDALHLGMRCVGVAQSET
jgi:hypothetical protein